MGAVRSFESHSTCPDAEQWRRLLRRPDDEGGRALFQHLLRCPKCWQELARLAASADADFELGAHPISLAVWSAAEGAGRPLGGRFARMRPLHRQDAWKASRSAESLARLVLHETLATAMRCPKLSGAEAFQVAEEWLQMACVGVLRPAARRDLTALGLVYRGYLALIRRRLGVSRRFLEAADIAMLGGEGRHEPRVTWWSVCATRHRHLALAARKGKGSWLGGISEDVDDAANPAQQNLSEASRCLRQALRTLPVRGYGEQRIELLHDQAQVCRLQGHLDTAERLLDRARQLFDALEDGDGGQLSPMVTMARTWVEAQRTVGYENDAARRLGERRVRALFRRVLETDYLGEAEKRNENRRLQDFLSGKGDAPAPFYGLQEEDAPWDRCGP